MEIKATIIQKKTITKPTVATRELKTMEMLFHRGGLDLLGVFAADSTFMYVSLYVNATLFRNLKNERPTSNIQSRLGVIE
jgi:hypothetical protein